MAFFGAKLALFLGPDLLVMLRDARPDIPYPGHWDLPGGGREGDETPVDCVLRETQEEVGLVVDPADLVWSVSYLRPRGVTWFFAAHLSVDRLPQVRLGSEGQRLELMHPDTYCAHPLAVPHFVERLHDYLSVAGSGRHS